VGDELLVQDLRLFQETGQLRVDGAQQHSRADFVDGRRGTRSEWERFGGCGRPQAPIHHWLTPSWRAWRLTCIWRGPSFVRLEK
jgi:hypothetical protein